jgi:zinc protease
LGGLPSDTGNAEGFRDLNINAPEGVSKHVLTKGKGYKSEVKIVFSGKFKYSQTNNIMLSALGAIIEFRLLDRLRELEGGVYTPQVGSVSGKLPRETYSLNINFTCDPGNVDKLITAAMDEIEKIKINGISSQDLEKFKAETLRNHEVRIKTDNYWLAYLVRQLTNDDDLTETNSFAFDVNSLKLEALQVAAKQYLSGKNLQQFILNPEKINN